MANGLISTGPDHFLNWAWKIFPFKSSELIIYATPDDACPDYYLRCIYEVYYRYIKRTNKAFSYNVKNAIGGVYPEFKIDYPMVLVNRGDLPNVQSPSVSSRDAGSLIFAWTDNSGKGKAKSTDMAFASVYNEVNSQWHYDLNISARNAGECILDLGLFKAKTLHSYLGFISADGKEVTDSIYAGLVNLE